MATSASPQLSAGLGLEHSKFPRPGVAARNQKTSSLLLLPLSKGVNGPYLDLLAPPVDLIHPLLGRMHPASLRLTFDNEILGCIKRMRAFASKVVPHDQDKDMTVKLKGKRGKEVDPAAAPLHVSPNTRRRLLSSQLTKCWDMFGPHIDSEYLYTRMVEAGESILTIDGFWDVARTTCFERILEEDVALSKEKVEDGATTITSSLFGLSADSVPGFAVPVIQESAPDTLLQRARYGVLVCKFHALQAVDPLFKSARVVSDMLDVAREILDVVGECYDLVDQNQVGYLVWQGTRSVRNMCELIGGGGWWSEIPSILSLSVSFIERCGTLEGLSYVGWKLDHYISMYQAYMHLDAHERAETVVNNGMTKVEEIGREDTTLADSSEIMTAAIYRLNVLIFGCEVRGIADGKQVASAEAILAARHGTAPSSAATGGRTRRPSISSFPRQSISVVNGEPVTSDDLQTSAGVTQSRLRKLSSACPIRGGTFWPTTSGSRKELGLSMIDLNASHTSVSGAFGGDHNSRISFQTDATGGDSSWVPKAGGRSLVRTLSMKAISQLKGKRSPKKGQNNPFSQKVVSAISIDADNQIAYGIRDDPLPEEDAVTEMPYRDLNQPLSRHQQQQQQESKKNRKAKLALPKLDDSEEGKAKRQILFDVLYMLASFHGDRDRFHAIVEGLLVISSASVKLTFIEKLSENFNRKEHLFMRLLDVGFEIILSQPDAFLTPAKVMAAYTTDMDLGRPPDKADIARITVHERLADLDLQDLMGFCRKLFEYQQWERFGILARILDEMFETEVFKHACSASEQEAASRELVLRLAAINFQNVVRSERKVEFDTATNTSMTDLSAERFLVSAQLQTAAIALLDSLADCIETESLVSQYPSLFVDTTRLLWEFLEPMTHSINSVADAPQCASLSMDSMLLILLRSLHAVLTELPSEDSLLLVDVGGKLALIMECMDCLQEAVEVLEDIEAVISIARCHFGEAADGVTSVTCNVNFHTKLPVASPAAGPVLESVTDGAGAADKLQVTRRNLACAAVSGYRRLARCRMKMWLKDREALQKKKVSEHLRLTNKDLRTTPIRTHVDEDKIALYCGENLTLRAMTLTVHASEGSNLPKAAKQRLLETAVSLLGRVYKDEGRMLTDILRNTHPKGHAPGVCPPPMFVRRSPTSVTMKAVHMRNALGETVVPHSYQLYCRKLGSDKMAIVTISDMAYPGSGHQVRTGRGDGCVELTVSGLSPNQKYAFAVCAFGRDGKTLGRGIGETSRPVVTCLPLPLLLCWGQIVNIAHEAHCEDIADQSYNLLKKHFVTWLAPDERLRRTAFESQVSDPYSEATFKLNDDDLETTAPSILRAFIESIYASIDRRFSKTHAIVHADIEGICDTLGAQNMRLTCCRELLIALELAKRIEDERLMLLSSFKCYELLVPFLLLDDVADPTKLQMNSPVPTPMPYIIQILTTCHATFIKCSAVLGNDRLHGVTDHYAYLAFHLIRRLTARKVPADIARAVKVAEDALALIHAIAGTSSDTRILSSATLEAEWLGPEHRAAKRRISKKRGKGRAIITDCAYHALLSTTTDFGKGYDLHRTRRLEAMCEYFDVEIGRAALAALPPGQPSSSRKTLDQASTSLREIYSLLTLSGPDVTIENITKFRKNPRYIEIMGLAAAWCLAAGHFIDTAIRICLDAEDWTEKRNYCVFRFEDLAENEEDETGGGGKQEDAWWSKRKKRAMFGDKSAGLLITKSEDRKRGRKAKRDPPSTKAVGGAKVQLSSSPARVASGGTKKDTVLNASSDGSKSRPSTGVEGVSASSKPASPGSAGAHGKQDGSNADSSRPITGQNLHSDHLGDHLAVRPVSPERHSRANSATSGRTEGTEDMVARKRQRGVLRQNYLANVPVADRDKIEKAARILDANLAAIWHRKRYSRRLRLVIEYEQPARARLSLIHGLASLAHLERDIIGKDAGNSDHGRRNKAETFELRHCGRILLEDFRLPAMRVPGTAALSQDPPSHDLFRFVMDSFQAIVQSIVLAARVGEWLQVLDSINQLWKIQRRLMRRNTLGGQDFRKNQLWRAWWVIGLCIIDFLQSVSVRKADGDDEATFAIAMPTSRPSTGRSFTYPSRPATATYAKIESAGNMLPFATMSEMTGHQFVAAWADRHGEMQMAFLDLPFLAQCCLFGIETMNAAKKYHRLMQFGLKFDQVFKGIYATILQPIMASAQQALQTRLGEDSLGQVSDQMDAWLDSQQYSTSPSQQLWFARGLSAEYRLGVLRSSTASVDFSDLYGDLTDAYEDTISLAEETKNRTLLVIAASEYADVLNASGDLDSACLFWSKAVDIIFNRQLVVGSWEQMFVAGDDWASENIPHYVSLTARAGGFRNLVLAATAVTKMVRARYAQIHLDKRQSLVSFAARTFSILLRGSLPHPANPVELAQYTPPFILPFLNIFSDCNRCDPWELVETLQFLGNELVITGRPWEAFPMGVLMEYMATHVCFSTPLICFARLIKAEALISLGNISDGLECFLSVSSGTALLADEKMFYAPPSSGAGAPLPSDVRYQDQVHLLDSLLNLRIIRYVADHALADRLIWFLGPDVARAFELTRCRILIKILEVAGLRDPGITSTKSAMLLHQEESPQESDSSEGAGEPSLDMFRQLSAGMRASTDSIVGAQTSVSRTSSHSNIGPASSAGRRPSNNSTMTTRTQRRDAASILGAILPRIEGIAGKLISDLQTDAQLLASARKAQTLLFCYEVMASVYLLRWNLESAIRCFAAMVSTTEEVDRRSHANDSPGLDLWCKLYFREQLVEALINYGAFQTASNEARKASDLARRLHSCRFWVSFEYLSLLAERHDEMSTSDAHVSMRVPDSWQLALESFESAVIEVSAKFGNESIIARSWEFLGDALSSFGLADANRISEIYRFAEASWMKIPVRTARRPSGYACTAPSIAAIKLKRVLSSWQSDKTVRSLEILVEDLQDLSDSCKFAVNLSPSLAIPLSATLASARAATRFAPPAEYNSKWQRCVTAYTEILAALVTEGGFNAQAISLALCSLQFLHADRVASDAGDDPRMLVAAIAYHAGKADALRRALIANTSTIENVKVKVQEMNPALVQEYLYWKKNDGIFDLANNIPFLDSPNAGETFGTVSTTPTTLKSQDLLGYMSDLVRRELQFKGLPSDAWEKGVSARIRRVHTCLAELVGAPYLSEKCIRMPEILDPKPDSSGSTTQAASQGLPDEASAFSWSGIHVKPSTEGSESCPTNRLANVSGIFVSVNKRKDASRGAKRQKTPLAGLPSLGTPKPGTPTSLIVPNQARNSLISPVLVVPVNVPVSLLQTIRGVLDKIGLVLSMSDSSTEFGDEINEIWQSVLENIRAAFGMIDQDDAPLGFSCEVLAILLQLFGVETPMQLVDCAAFSYKSNSTKDPDHGLVFAWLSRMANQAQAHRDEQHSLSSKLSMTAAASEHTARRSRLWDFHDG